MTIKYPRLALRVAGATLFLSVNFQIAAQDALDEVIVTAGRPTSVGKLDAPLKDQPQNTTVISRSALDALGAPRVEDITYSTVGIQAVAPAQGVTNYGFFVRGFNGAPTIVDGYYSSVNAFGSVGVFDLATVESVEVLRGPASILYGQGNPGGIVNLTTKTPMDTFGATAKLLGDEHGARRFEGDVTGPLGSAGYRVVGVLEDSDSFRDFVNHERRLIAPTLFVEAGDRAEFRFNYVYDRLEYSPDNGPGVNPDLITNLPVDSNVGEPWLEPIKLVSQSFRAEMDFRFNDAWKARLGYFNNRSRTPNGTREIDADATLSGTLISRTFNETTAENNGFDNYMATLQLLGKFSTGAFEHNITAAIDYVDNRSTYDYNVSGIDTPFDYADPQYSDGTLAMTPWYSGEGAFNSYVRGGYVQDLISIGDRWKVLAGVRRDDITTVGYADADATQRSQTSVEHSVTPRLGVVYQPSETSTLYASHSEAFVPLIGSDRFDDPYRPEESRSFELGLRQQFGASLLLTAAIYDIEKKNIIVVDPADTNFNINAGVARSRGGELELAGSFSPNWRITAGLAYTDARIEESVDPAFFPKGDRLPGTSKWMALLNSRYRFSSGPVAGLEVGGNIAYGSARPYVVPNNEIELDAYTRIDAFVSYDVNDSFEVQLNASNLTDERILLANGYGRAQFDPSRTVMLSMRYRVGEGWK
jgi:iron complex outermembrane recepter protein